MIRQPRNSKCYCGSGKKAKKCCLLTGRQGDDERQAFRKSDIARFEAGVTAGVGGAITFENPDEPSMAPPRWLAWLVLLALVFSVIGAAFALFTRLGKGNQMASAAAGQTVNSTGLNVFDEATDGGPCTEFLVGVSSAALKPALVNIPGLHKTGEFMGLPIGTSLTFANSKQGNATQHIQTVFVKGNGGDTIIDYGVVSKQEIVR